MRLIALLLLALPAFADVRILVDGSPRREYIHEGKTYVEALRGREYTIRLTNPTGERVAVALAVDGLNTIDAKHTSAWSASKWVLGPYETVDLKGWQVSDSAARRFVFTTEPDSYGAVLGRTDDLGVIEAVFYRERRRPVAQYRERSEVQSAPSAAPPSAKAQAEGALSDAHAATGMGDRTRHEVERVNIELDPSPIEHARIRYEFRPQLVELGVILDPPSPLRRRERARGFERYCPEP
jgi:hypothetical protein